MANTIVLDGPLSRTRGVIGRYPEADEEFWLEYTAVRERPIHMIGVRRPLRVEWYAHGALVAEETLEPWTGRATHRADTVVESRP